MSYPHDYYDHSEFPELHNHDEDKPYIEPDYFAHGHMAGLPALSTMGRGPRGEGLYVDGVVEQDGNVSFGLYSTLTGEKLWQSPNLAPAHISFNIPDWRDLVPGSPAPIDIVVQQGGKTSVTKAYLPAGDRGSLVYLLGGTLTRSVDDTYQVPIESLTIYNNKRYPEKPTPRQNDIVCFGYIKNGEYGSAVGTIEAVESGKVIFTGRVFIPATAAIVNPDSLDSPQFTGTPTAPTAVAGTDTTQIATTEFVQRAISDKADATDVPNSTSDLTNDSNYVSDISYVHTDNNYTSAEKTKLSNIETEANNYSLPTMSTDVKGGAKVGNGLEVTNDILSVDITPTDIGAISASEKGATNGVAELDENGYIVTNQIPGYADSIDSYSDVSLFPATGDSGVVYVDTTTNKTYRWTGSDYVEISSSLALGETSSTAYRGDRGAEAYAHGVTNKGTALANGLYKLTTNSEGHVTAGTAVTGSDITGLISGEDIAPDDINATGNIVGNSVSDSSGSLADIRTMLSNLVYNEPYVWSLASASTGSRSSSFERASIADIPSGYRFAGIKAISISDPGVVLQGYELSNDYVNFTFVKPNGTFTYLGVNIWPLLIKDF